MRQHTTPLLVAGTEEGATAEALERLQFGKGNGDAVSYLEGWLQRLVQRHPGLLPIEEVEPAYTPVVPVCMELPTARGLIDNFFVTPTGNLVFAECKLWRNPEMRRQVVAQVMDYAQSLTALNYAALEEAVRRGVLPDGSRPTGSLYDRVARDAQLDEAGFIDAVSRNLRLGRGLFFIVGDGIREETEMLVDHLQGHAGIHFALALTELALYRLPGGNQLLVQPRLIARTVNIERGIVRLEDSRLSVIPADTPAAAAAQRQSLSAEEFYEQMRQLDQALPDRIRAFLARIEPLGVAPEFRRTMILRWQAVDGTRINIGYVDIGGRVWTDLARWPGASPPCSDLTQDYVREVAALIGGEIRRASSDPEVMSVVVNGTAPEINLMLQHQDSWIAAMETLASAINGRIEDAAS
ncbi:MAG: hypothetical protein GEU28_13255 [Dehalococcoidia bacterium]|nr:hypothetical protein [Dehalococcoidia bacterium]